MVKTIAALVVLVTSLCFCFVSGQSDSSTTRKPLRPFEWDRDNNPPIYAHKDKNGTIIGGDILTRPTSSDVAKAGSRDTNTRWRNAILYYSLPIFMTDVQRQNISRALSEIESKTCIRFQRRVLEPDYVDVTLEPRGCFSYLGRTGGRQQLNLGPGCFIVAIIEHEFLHALGVIHEHTRPDQRDNVFINYLTIPFFLWPQFFPNSNDRVNTFGLPYEYGSVMHYERRAGSVTFFDSIIPRKRNAVLGNLNGVTDLDVQKLRVMYNCPS